MTDAPDAPDLGHTLGRKIGPLPLAGWLAAIGGGLAISLYLRRHQAAAAPADPGTVAPGTSGMTDGTGGAAVSDPSYAGNVSAPTGYDSTGTTAAPLENNGQWRQQAVKWLVGNGSGGIAAEIAVGNYLSGGTLSLDQADMVNKAVAAIGPTPEAVPSINVAAPTPPAPTPTPNAAPTTNAAWRKAALAYMIAHGHQPTGSAAALDNYLGGQPVGPKGLVAVNEAIRAIGPPPQTVKRRDTGKHTHPRR